MYFLNLYQSVVSPWLPSLCLPLSVVPVTSTLPTSESYRLLYCWVLSLCVCSTSASAPSSWLLLPCVCSVLESVPSLRLFRPWACSVLESVPSLRLFRPWVCSVLASARPCVCSVLMCAVQPALMSASPAWLLLCLFSRDSSIIWVPSSCHLQGCVPRSYWLSGNEILKPITLTIFG